MTLWYVTRGTGVVALLLLTASVMLGVVSSLGWRTDRWPRFAVNAVHRNLTLLAVGFVVVHVVTTVLDAYAPVSLVAAVVPFTSPYRPIWLGLGAVAFDLLLALVVSSLARGWTPPRAWRTVHWAAYVAWPVALLHAFGTGSDARVGWFTWLGIACLGGVAAAATVRAVQSGRTDLRLGGVAAALAVTAAVLVWYHVGPSQRGWAKRSGTPTGLLASRRVRTTPQPADPPPKPPTSFVSALAGTLSQSPAPNGEVTIHLLLRLRGGPRGAARVDLQGVPGHEGVAMTASGVSFVPATTRAVYAGKVVALDGSRVVADVRDAAGDKLQLGFQLQIDPASRTVSGMAVASPSGGAE
jgi:DMSO/TMAO reductase YedYZ heme-binding membrane subunit